jgi:hypothetical protein
MRNFDSFSRKFESRLWHVTVTLHSVKVTYDYVKYLASMSGKPITAVNRSIKSVTPMLYT